MQELSLATRLQIEQAEWGELPTDNWDDYPWADEIRYTIDHVPFDVIMENPEFFAYVPDDLEREEALSFFDEHPVEAFEAWVSDLDDRSFQGISDALRVLRSAIVRFHAERDARINMIDILAELE